MLNIIEMFELQMFPLIDVDVVVATSVHIIFPLETNHLGKSYLLINLCQP